MLKVGTRVRWIAQDNSAHKLLRGRTYVVKRLYPTLINEACFIGELGTKQEVAVMIRDLKPLGKDYISLNPINKPRKI